MEQQQQPQQQAQQQQPEQQQQPQQEKKVETPVCVLNEQQTHYMNLVIEEYYKSVQETEKFWLRDNKQALKIQATYKMFRMMKLYTKSRRCAIKIEKNFRAFYAKIVQQKRKEQEINKKNVEYFSNQVIVIQKFFRGFHKRKYIHDFYARKQFLNLLKQKDEKFLQDLNKVAKEEQIEEQRRQEAAARQEFTELAKNLHHLSSTYNIPGVYNPPFANGKPQAFNIDVETHLKATFKANYKWKPPTKDDIEKYSLNPIKKLTPKLTQKQINNLLKQSQSSNQQFKQTKMSNQQSSSIKEEQQLIQTQKSNGQQVGEQKLLKEKQEQDEDQDQAETKSVQQESKKQQLDLQEQLKQSKKKL